MTRNWTAINLICIQNMSRRDEEVILSEDREVVVVVYDRIDIQSM